MRRFAWEFAKKCRMEKCGSLCHTQDIILLGNHLEIGNHWENLWWGDFVPPNNLLCGMQAWLLISPVHVPVFDPWLALHIRVCQRIQRCLGEGHASISFCGVQCSSNSIYPLAQCLTFPARLWARCTGTWMDFGYCMTPIQKNKVLRYLIAQKSNQPVIFKHLYSGCLLRVRSLNIISCRVWILHRSGLKCWNMITFIPPLCHNTENSFALLSKRQPTYNMAYSKCMDTALSPLWLQWMRILNCLDGCYAGVQGIGNRAHSASFKSLTVPCSRPQAPWSLNNVSHF